MRFKTLIIAPNIWFAQSCLTIQFECLSTMDDNHISFMCRVLAGSPSSTLNRDWPVKHKVDFGLLGLLCFFAFSESHHVGCTTPFSGCTVCTVDSRWPHGSARFVAGESFLKSETYISGNPSGPQQMGTKANAKIGSACVIWSENKFCS